MFWIKNKYEYAFEETYISHKDIVTKVEMK